MSREAVFSEVGFPTTVRPAYDKLTSFIEALEGCGAKVYKPKGMKQARAAHVIPTLGKKNAKQVFLMIDPRREGMLVSTRGRFMGWRSKRETSILITSTFAEWEELQTSMLIWSDMAKGNRPAPTSYDNGDGIALHGGLPMTKRSKF